MKTGWTLVMIGLGLSAMAQDRMAESLRKGVVEEESQHNLDAAIQNYQVTLSQYDEARGIAATALFRMADSYRKEGKSEQAISAYKRLVQEFADQRTLADQSRSILSDTYHVPAQTLASNQTQDLAREEYKASLLQQLQRMKQTLARYRVLQSQGVIASADVDKAEMALLDLQKQLAALEGSLQPPAVK